MSQDFYSDIVPFRDFASVVNADAYLPLPDDWVVGVSDVVNSTGALKAGRYKAVNMAGAATISAVTNALDNQPFPVVFGGDGARFAVAGEHAPTIRKVLSKTAAWAQSELKLDLRVALVSMETIRATGHEVRVARFAASPSVSYASFTGGGVEWAESEVKAGKFLLDPAPPGSEPDLTGLSCQWGPIESANGVILSIIAKPKPGADPDSFADMVRTLLDKLERQNGRNPVPDDGPKVGWPSGTIGLQASVVGPKRKSRLGRLVSTYFSSALAWIVLKSGKKVGGFDPVHYRRQVGLNTDFRKYDDGLMMTVDCSLESAVEIEALLETARQEGLADFGLHRQETALLTCVVPSTMTDDHLHFLDGGEGGYARAAEQLKAG
ncbi:MAG: DUF3095 domain-containing protein [Pseudomonadota bacterium]